MTATRPLNAFETLFASYNVRFALLAVLETTTTDLELEETAQLALDSCRVGHLSLAKSDKDDKWSLNLNETDNFNKVVMRTVPGNFDKNYGSFLDDIVEQETHPAAGPLSMGIFVDKSASCQTKLLLVNGNHAMVDGRSLTHLLGLATKMYEPSVAWKAIPLPDWKDMVAACPSATLVPDPPFILGEHHNLLTMQDICPVETSQSESLRCDISGETVTALRLVLKHRAKGATISGFLAAVISHAIALEYEGEEPKDVGISMLVDLRPYLHRKNSNVDEEIPQAHGTVTLMESTDRLKSSDINSLLEVAVRLTQQMRLRINRGEAHRNALAVTNGHFDERAGPPATMELSNLGVCQIPDGAKLYTSQRFDGYNGVSFMAHSEANSLGCMRWNMSVGEGLDTAVVKQIFTRAHDLLQKVAKAKST